jgi:hypothetical protein
MKRRGKYLLFVALFLTSIAECTELMPWYNRDLELYPRLDALYQSYPEVQSARGHAHRGSDDLFLRVGISGSYSPWYLSLEAVGVKTRKRSFSLDSGKITGKYQWMSDIVGDPVTMTTGVTLISATSSGLKTIGSFHHGQTEGEAHIAIGKENTCLQTWSSRYWAFLGFGLGNYGSPWTRGQIAWEKNIDDTLFASVFLNALCGLGDRSLRTRHFHGYGSVRHRSVDVGFKASKHTWESGNFALEYAYRVYARNFPNRAHLIQLTYIYPFGL